jgi:hypothetical protein
VRKGHIWGGSAFCRGLKIIINGVMGQKHGFLKKLGESAQVAIFKIFSKYFTVR